MSGSMRSSKSALAATIALAWLATSAVVAQSSQRVAVTVSDPAPCSPMAISWDTTGGQAPWTVTVAPLGHVPSSVELAPDYASGSRWTYNWDVPRFGPASITQLIVAVTDAQGRHAGTSAIKTIGAGSASCATTSTNQPLDFVWYPELSDPKQCRDWRLSFEEDKGNLGIERPVDFLILPEEDVPTRLRVAGASSTHIDWTVNYKTGTRFAVAGLDSGEAMTGGVGGTLYRVASGGSTGCMTKKQTEVIGGVPKATTTVRQADASPTGRITSARASSTHAASSAKPTSDPRSGTAKGVKGADDKEEEDSHTAAKAGAVVGGILGAAALIGLLVWAFLAYRRKQGHGAEHSEKEAKGSHRWSAGGPGNVEPFPSNGRRSPWRQSAMVIGRNFDNDHGPLVSRRHDFGTGSEMGHASSSSISLHRGRDSYGGTGSAAMSTLSHAPTVHSIVPDDALFPPPLPMNHRMVPQYQQQAPQQPQYQQQPQRYWPSNSSPPGSRGIDRDPSGAIHNKPYSRESIAALQGLPLSPSSAHRSPTSPTVRDVIHETAERRQASQVSPASPLASARNPPSAPATTTLFDPHVHTSQRYDADEAAQIAAMVNDNAQQLERFSPTPPPPPRSAPAGASFRNGAGAAPSPSSLRPIMTSGKVAPDSPRYADPKEGQAWLSMLDDQLKQERKRVVSSASMASSVGLPYM